MSPGVAGLRAASRLSTLERFLGWWFGELAALLVGGEAEGLGSRRVVVERDDGELRFTLRGGRRIAELARVPGGDMVDARPLRRVLALLRRKVPLVLRVGPEAGLVRAVSLPIGAEHDLDSVMAFELARQTPFQPHQAAFDFALVGRDRGAKRLDVRLAVVPLATIAAVEGQLAASGLRLDAVELPLEEGGVATILRDRSRRAGRLRRGAWLRNGLLFALLLALLGALAAQHLHERARLAADLEARVEQAKAEAEDVAALREGLLAAHARASFLRLARQERVPAIAVLDEVSRVLPDDTWLARLDLAGDALDLQGEAKEATRLIALLDGSAMLAEVQFRSPVTRTPDGTAERFHVGARIVRDEGSP
jgi:general secretion pathway protein L